MIIYHPIQVSPETKTKIIEKYKDRQVYIFNSILKLWYGGIFPFPLEKCWNKKELRNEMTFKDALKKTKHFKEHSGVEYHFISGGGIGDEIPNIKDFDQEDVYNCPSIIFQH